MCLVRPVLLEISCLSAAIKAFTLSCRLGFLNQHCSFCTAREYSNPLLGEKLAAPNHLTVYKVARQTTWLRHAASNYRVAQFEVDLPAA